MTKYIITFTPHFKKTVLDELSNADTSVSIEFLIDEGKALINCNQKESAFISNLKKSNPIFIKHIFPVQQTGDISGNLSEDLKSILDSCSKIVKMKDSKFAVQCRLTSGSNNYSAKDIEVGVGMFYEEKGNIPSFSDKNLLNEDIYVISVYIYKDKYFLGFSKSDDNLNFHCDEARIFSVSGREISRAENKLKEALSKFKITLSGKGKALDLGAAPGGWTKVLADFGYDVVAVDPGDLDLKLSNNPKIIHQKVRIENLEFNEEFDVITNDMNLEPKNTAEIMVNLAHCLKDKGIAIVTLKLPFNPIKGIEEAKAVLSEKYEVLEIKSLFHNRQEVTAYIRKK